MCGCGCQFAVYIAQAEAEDQARVAPGGETPVATPGIAATVVSLTSAPFDAIGTMMLRSLDKLAAAIAGERGGSDLAIELNADQGARPFERAPA